MKQLGWVLKWLLYGAIFFTCFAFALNNQQDAVLRFFFGSQLRLPMVLIVLAAFTAGMAFGALAMVPRWWRQRGNAIKAIKANPKASEPANDGI